MTPMFRPPVMAQRRSIRGSAEVSASERRRSRKNSALFLSVGSARAMSKVLRFFSGVELVVGGLGGEVVMYLAILVFGWREERALLVRTLDVCVEWCRTFF